MRILALSGLAVLTVALAACGEGKAGWKEIGVDELEKLMREKKVVVIDNNPKFVYEKRRLPGAKWLNATKYTAADLPEDKAATLAFYCMNED